MSAPDYRYLQAWARPSASQSASVPRRAYDAGANSYEVILPTTDGDTATPATPTTTGKHDAQQSSSYQVRLDTPGGISYAPDALAQHNSLKRLFIPANLRDRSAQPYDFTNEIEQHRDWNKPEQSTPQPELDELGRTQAQAYKQSFLERLDSTYAAGQSATQDAKPFVIPTQEGKHSAPQVSKHQQDDEAASIRTTATMASVQSKMTTFGLATGRVDKLAPNVSAHALTAPLRAPPSVSGDAANARTPWASCTTWTTHRALDRLTEKEKKLGITQFQDATEGRVPSTYEASLFRTSDSDADAATISTVRPHELRVEDLFVPDPRPWRPLRYVRKIDPRQMLILCAGAALTPGQVAALKLGSDASSVLTTNTSASRLGACDTASIYSAVPTQFSVEATRKAMFAAGTLPDYKTLEAQLKMSAATSAPTIEQDEKRAGLGFVFCPTHDARAQTPAYKRSPDVTIETNFSRRLEKPRELCHSTVRRAALRAALAALEFTRWEAEGFDKIVIATHHAWLVDAISSWIWEWRHNKWTIMTVSPLGQIGDQVPDRDLWELLDSAVKSYEEIDCTVRFWKITKEQNSAAVQLAQQGACKDNQQPGTVRWTKKKVASST